MDVDEEIELVFLGGNRKKRLARLGYNEES
jgi:hypothetical protein